MSSYLFLKKQLEVTGFGHSAEKWEPEFAPGSCCDSPHAASWNSWSPVTTIYIDLLISQEARAINLSLKEQPASGTYINPQ